MTRPGYVCVRRKLFTRCIVLWYDHFAWNYSADQQSLNTHDSTWFHPFTMELLRAESSQRDLTFYVVAISIRKPHKRTNGERSYLNVVTRAFDDTNMGRTLSTTFIFLYSGHSAWKWQANNARLTIIAPCGYVFFDGTSEHRKLYTGCVFFVNRLSFRIEIHAKRRHSECSYLGVVRSV